MASEADMEKILMERYGKAKESAATPLELLQAYVFAGGMKGVRKLRRALRKLDKKGDRMLDLAMFTQAIRDEGLEADDATIKEVFTQLDKGGTGQIDFDEFMLALMPPLTDSRTAIIEDAFKLVDKSGKGEFPVDELKPYFETHPWVTKGKATAEEVYQLWLARFGAKETDTITKQDFINYYIAVSAAVDTDERFVDFMKRTWNM